MAPGQERGLMAGSLAPLQRLSVPPATSPRGATWNRGRPEFDAAFHSCNADAQGGWLWGASSLYVSLQLPVNLQLFGNKSFCLLDFQRKAT